MGAISTSCLLFLALTVTIQLPSAAGRPVVIRKLTKPPLPVIFIPGKGGNQLEAKVTREDYWPGRSHCPKQMEWHRIWMDLWSFFTGGVDCWAENMQLRYNRTTGRSYNAPGVETRVPGWGSTDVIEYVDPSWTAWIMGNLGVYATYLIEALKQHGYERGVSVRGAPYDFRYAPHSQPEFFDDLRRLVEETSAANDGRKVILLGHSLGGLFATYFLSEQTAEWKDRHVAALVTANTPWAGAVVIAEMHAAGINWEIDAIDRLVVRGQQRSYETGILLLPSRDVWSLDEVIVSTPSRNFTVADYDEFFDVIGHNEGRLVLKAMGDTPAYRRYVTDHPGVPVHCLHGAGVPTPETLVYDADEDFPDKRPREVMGDGDGTVNARSLMACGRWVGQDEKRPVVVRQFDGINHNDLLSEADFVDYVLDVATS